MDASIYAAADGSKFINVYIRRGKVHSAMRSQSFIEMRSNCLSNLNILETLYRRHMEV